MGFSRWDNGFETANGYKFCFWHNGIGRKQPRTWQMLLIEHGNGWCSQCDQHGKVFERFFVSFMAKRQVLQWTVNNIEIDMNFFLRILTKTNILNRHSIRWSALGCDGCSCVYDCSNEITSDFIIKNVAFDLLWPWITSCCGIYSYAVSECKQTYRKHKSRFFQRYFRFFLSLFMNK